MVCRDTSGTLIHSLSVLSQKVLVKLVDLEPVIAKVTNQMLSTLEHLLGYPQLLNLDRVIKSGCSSGHH